MFIKTNLGLAALVILMLVSGCDSVGTISDNSYQTDDKMFPQNSGESLSSPQLPSYDSGWTRSGDEAVWPDYIPDDIPVLEGKIRLVMEAPGSHIRIFYEDLTKEQIDQYLSLLEVNGFRLVYQVYVQEGFPDNSEERLKKGDYDAVDITKGEYHMNIAYGEGDISYDIYTTGFSEAIPPSTGLDWPVDLVNVVPKPDQCPIQSLAPDSSGGYQITCRPGDADVKDDYIKALQASGFLPKPTSSRVSVEGVYGLDDLEIIVEQHSTALILIQIWHVDVSTTTWPAALAGIVPTPQGCQIRNVLDLGGRDFMISCANPSDSLTSEYIDLLVAYGFIESNRMEMPNGDLISADLVKGNINVELLISISGDLIINISEEP
jgi:hypothetical protein